MTVAIEIKNVDLGANRDISDPTEQVALLCTAIAHADETPGHEVRALLRLAFELGGDAISGARALLSAAAVACHGIRLDVEEAADTLADNMETCAAHEAGEPSSS